MLADPEICARDIPFITQLGINTLDILSIDPKISHTSCMKLLQDAGIYVLIALNGDHSSAPHGFIDGSSRILSHDYEMMDYYTSIIDSFQRYPNTLGFFVRIGHKSMSGINTIPTWKATVRNMKEYIATKNYRKIPIGATASDHNRMRVADYMNCGERNNSIDFFGINRPSDETSCADISSWFDEGIVDEYREFSIPTYFKAGCLNDLRGNFDEIPIIYSNTSSSVFSGAIVNAWTDFITSHGGDFG
jgi:hypothetical protein